MPKAASHNRVALSRTVSKTGARSPGEELMTCNTSAVAVCCSSASSSSSLACLRAVTSLTAPTSRTRPAVRGAHQQGVVLNPAVFATNEPHPVFANQPRRLALQSGAQRGAVSREIGGVDAGIPILARPLGAVPVPGLPPEQLD